MTNQVELAITLSPEEQRLFEETIARFELAWHQNSPRNLDDFLPDDGSLRTALLEELIAIDIEFRQRQGESIDKDEYQRRFAELKVNDPKSANPSTVSLAQQTVAQQPVDTLKVEQAELPTTFGRYRIVKALGQGAMGAVYLAHDQQLDRQVALKIPKFVEADSQELLARFYREARLAAALRHPNICPVFDVGEIDGRHYITMAYIEGRALSEFVTSKRMQPLRQVAMVLRKLAIALEEAHARGVIHRDLKPANIMIDAKGEPIVMDFGLARRASNEDAQVTHSGAILGTPAYMSPEQAEGDQTQIGPAADVYSLGVILYELLTGQRPFQGSVMSVLQQIGIGKPQPPSQLRTDIDPVLEGICLKMMSRHQAKRHPSMAAVAQSLSEYLKSTPGRTSQTTSVSTSVQESSERTPDEDANVATFLFPSASDAVAVLPATKILEPSQRAAVVATRPADRRRHSRNWYLVGTGLAGIGLLLAAIFFIRFGNVDVKVVIDDPHLVVKFNGQTVTFEGSGSPIRLKPGEHKFIVERDGLEVETDHFTVKKNGKHVLEVSIVDGRVVVRKDDQEPMASGLASRSDSSSSSIIGQQRWPADAPSSAIAPFDAEQAKRHQENWAKYLKVPVVYTNSIGMKFVLIPPGKFTMGSTPEEIEATLQILHPNDSHWAQCTRSESPQHTVILTKPIYLGVHEVTQAQYERVMGSNPSHFAPMGTGKDMVAGMETTGHPVEMVSWNDAAEFSAKLSQQENLTPFYDRVGEQVTLLNGNGYRLPTEAEWEFACRAGTTTKYWTGDNHDDPVGAGWWNPDAGSRTHAVGELPSNPFGVYDVCGNVFEWVQDRWKPTYYAEFQEMPAVNPSGPSSVGLRHVTRGGAWPFFASTCGSSLRVSNFPTYRVSHVGFRVALPVDAAKVARQVKPASVTKIWRGWPADAPPPAIAPFNAEQAEQHQEAWAKYVGVPVEYTNSIGMKFRLVPPGEFRMGSTPAEIEEALMFAGADTRWQNSIKSASPEHKVTLTQPVYLGVHEVTQAEYEKVMGTNPSHFTPLGSGKDAVTGLDTTRHPVETVSWNDAAEFCTKLSEREKLKPFKFELRAGETMTMNGTGYRLPTEAEWEFACRAGTTSKYWSGDSDEDLMRVGWFVANSGGRTHAAGELSANPFGLFDLHGSVWEWVQDVWEPTYYGQLQVTPALDPSGPSSAGSERVVRGGSWYHTASPCRSSHRDARNQTSRRNRNDGFRVSLSVEAVKAALANPARTKGTGPNQPE
ncbi:MAG: SUMF1/EgtB/PvdO family nonheme iron enzyme [Planctomycetaceae bacterium]